MYYILIILEHEKFVLFVNDKTLHKLLHIIDLSISMIDTDIVIAIMSFGNLVIEYTELGKRSTRYYKTIKHSS